MIIIRDNNQLGWKECRAIAECMKIASRGTEIDNKKFENHCSDLQSTFGSMKGPFFEQGRIAVVLRPGTGSVKIKDKHTISNVSLSFDDNNSNNLTIQAITHSKVLYVISIHSDNGDYLFKNDCRALIDILYFFETGDQLDPDSFLCCLYILLSRYNILILNANEKNNYKATIYPSSTKSSLSIPPTIKMALMRRNKNIPDSSDFENVTSIEAETLVEEDMEREFYPGIKIVQKLQESGQAQVFEGLNQRKQKVAVKVFTGTGNEPAETYKNELRMLLKMPVHKNVIEVIDFFDFPRPALITKWIEGAGDLSNFLESHRSMGETEARNIAIGIAEGVAHLHKSGVVHRDLKPANILLEKSWLSGQLNPIIIDLGLSSTLKRLHGTNEHVQDLIKSVTNTRVSQTTGAIKGSVFWICPEMIRKCTWSEKTDVYAFGIILWELLSGKEPYTGEKFTGQVDLLLRVRNGLRPEIESISHVSEELKKLIIDCWSDDPLERPTMMQVLDRLRGNDPKAIFESIDNDGNWTLEFLEFTVFMKRYKPTVRDSEIYQIFQAIDEYNNEKIEFNEFMKFWNIVQRQGLNNALEVCRIARCTRLKIKQNNM